MIRRKNIINDDLQYFTHIFYCQIRSRSPWSRPSLWWRLHASPWPSSSSPPPSILALSTLRSHLCYCYYHHNLLSIGYYLANYDEVKTQLCWVCFVVVVVNVVVVVLIVVAVHKGLVVVNKHLSDTPWSFSCCCCCCCCWHSYCVSCCCSSTHCCWSHFI